jgi:hypothetical protein
LDTSDVKFIEDYLYFDFYIDDIAEEDMEATVNTVVSEAIKATRYDGKRNEITQAYL